APVACPIAQVVKEGWGGGGPALDELRMVTGDRAELRLMMGRDVEDERWPLVQPKVQAEEVDDLLEVVRLSRRVGFRGLCCESGGIDQGAGSHVVGMGVFPVMGNENAGPKLADDAGQPSPGVGVGDDGTIRQAEVA